MRLAGAIQSNAIPQNLTYMCDRETAGSIGLILTLVKDFGVLFQKLWKSVLAGIALIAKLRQIGCDGFLRFGVAAGWLWRWFQRFVDLVSFNATR